MSNYVKQAKTEADAYAKRRKQEALERIEQTNAAAEAEKQEATATTNAAVREKQRTALDTLDAAAVERRVERENIRQAMAGWGLTDSGVERAKLRGADSVASRRGATARRTRDEAVAALKTALANKTAAIESERLTAVTAEKQQADKDADDNRAKLMKAAYDAEAKETAAREKAEAQKEAARQKAEAQERTDAINYQKQVLEWKREDAEKIEKQLEKERKEQEKAEAEANKESSKTDKAAEEAAKREETKRIRALSALRSDGKISGEVFAEALMRKWSVEEALSQQHNYNKYNRAIAKAVAWNESQDFDTVMAGVAPYDLPPDFQKRLAEALGVEYKRVREWLEGYQNFKQTSDKAKEMDALW